MLLVRTGARSQVRGAQRLELYLVGVVCLVFSGRYDRVVERRRAVALARRCGEAEGISIAQIAQCVGRSPPAIMRCVDAGATEVLLSPVPAPRSTRRCERRGALA
jgi:hypothetical protein